MKRIFTAACLCFAFALPAAAQEAMAKMKGADGKDLGTVTITATKSGMMVVMVDMVGLPPGAHGFHVHATGKCEAAGFDSAGGHLADGKSHGVMAENGPHPGDFPNVHAAQDGTAKAEFFTDKFTVADSEVVLMDDDGAAVVLHEGPDDYATDPSGHSGKRLACGVVEQRT